MCEEFSTPPDLPLSLSPHRHLFLYIPLSSDSIHCITTININEESLLNINRFEDSINKSSPTPKNKKNLYHDYIHLLFLHVHREVTDLVKEIPEESDQFRYLRSTCSVNLKGSTGLILDWVQDAVIIMSYVGLLSSWPIGHSVFYPTTSISSFSNKRLFIINR